MMTLHMTLLCIQQTAMYFCQIGKLLSVPAKCVHTMLAFGYNSNNMMIGTEQLSLSVVLR